MRKESDLLGELLIPEDKYYGVQTLRSLQLNPVSSSRMCDYPGSIQALATLKKICAQANKNIGALDTVIADAIMQATNEVIAGKFNDQFEVDMYSGGGGIAMHMNINEVLANRANELLTGKKGYDRVHPNTHVNMCQSTNDVLPSAMKLTMYWAVQRTCDSIRILEQAFAAKAKEFEKDVKLARTCLQDALPITFGQEFSGYASVIKRQRERLEHCMQDGWLDLTLGGTAVGTGMGMMPGFFEEVYRLLREQTHQDIKPDANIFDGMQNPDGYLYLSGILKCLAVSLSKISFDLKMLSSGPFAGFGEITLPAVQPGSSIMPGKVNPSLPELIIQIAQQVCGNDLTITMAVEKGELDLSIAEQILLKTSLDSLSLLEKSLPIFADKCIAGITINGDKALLDAQRSPALVTMVSILFGYEAGLAIARKAKEEQTSIKQAAVDSGIVSPEQAEDLFNVLNLTDRTAMENLLAKYASIRSV